MSTSETAGATPLRRDGTLWAGVALSLTVVAAIWSVPWVPSVDGPHHILSGFLSNHLAETGADSFLEVGAPVTSLGYHWLFRPLEPWLGWLVAHRVVVTCITLGWAWAAWWTCRRLVGSRWLSLLAFGLTLRWPIYMGFLPFCSASVLGLVIFGAAIPGTAMRSRHRALLAGALFLQAMMHVFPAALTGIVLLAVRSVRARHRWREAALMTAAGLPAACVVLALVLAGAGSASAASVGTEAAALWLPLGERLLTFGATALGGPWWRSALTPGIIIVGGVVGLRVPNARLYALVAIGLSCVALSMPLHTTAWEYLSPRFAGVATVFGLVALCAAVPNSRYAGLAAAVFAVASNLWALGYHEASWHVVEPALAVARQPPETTGWRLPLVFDPYGDGAGEVERPMRFVKPLVNIADLFVVEGGGMTPYLFGSVAALHPVVFRSDLSAVPPVPDRSLWRAISDPGLDLPEAQRDAALQTWLAAGTAYEEVILIHAPPGAAAGRGYVTVAGSGAAERVRFRGCTLDLMVVDRPPGVTTALSWAWYPSTEFGPALPVADAGTRPLERLAIEGVPCGVVLFRLVGATADGELVHCEGSAPGGDMLTRSDSSDRFELACRLVR